jgi:hypothetical protein
MRFWFSRAASHSNDYLEVGKFKSAEQAKKALEAIKKFIEEVDNNPSDYDWHSQDASYGVDGKRVYFSTYTAGYGLDEVESIIEREGGKVVACGSGLHSISFTIEKPSWNELKATIMVINLLHNKVLDPESYQDSIIKKSRKDGKCIWTLKALTDNYDEDLIKIHGVSLDDLEQLGVRVSIDE